MQDLHNHKCHYLNLITMCNLVLIFFIFDMITLKIASLNSFCFKSIYFWQMTKNIFRCQILNFYVFWVRTAEMAMFQKSVHHPIYMYYTMYLSFISSLRYLANVHVFLNGWTVDIWTMYPIAGYSYKNLRWGTWLVFS